jgi:predicted ATPase
VIASVAFRNFKALRNTQVALGPFNFKALRNTQVALGPFNLIIGPNGSGKTSLIQALTRLRDLHSSPVGSYAPFPTRAEGLEVTFQFSPPFADVQARLGCSEDFVCDFLQVKSARPDDWPPVAQQLGRLRSYVFDHRTIAAGSTAPIDAPLDSEGGNIASVLAGRKSHAPQAYAAVEAEFCRLLPEFARLEIETTSDGRRAFFGVLRDGGKVAAENLSQGTLYLIAMLTVAFDPNPPPLICIEELDRGLHPRMLREVRDVLYRLSYPSSVSLTTAPVQIVATTHSPYLLDLFRDHPEEVIIAQKQGQEARFERLSDRPDIHDILQEGGTLGDLWYTGILGGVPEEKPLPGRE